MEWDVLSFIHRHRDHLLVEFRAAPGAVSSQHSHSANADPLTPVSFTRRRRH